MKRGWSQKPLGDLVDVLDRLRKPITKKDRKAGPYPYYGATGVLDYVDGYLFNEPLVLIGEDGAKWEAGANSAFPIVGKTWVNNHAHVIRPHRNKVLDDWLIYYLNGADLMPFISGMTVPKLNQGRLLEIPIPLPPLEEQRRIVAVLDEAFEGLARARAHAEANLQNARDLFVASLRSLFSDNRENWPLRNIADVCSEFGRGKSRHRPRNDPHLYGGDMPFVQTGDLSKADHFLREFSQTYSAEGVAQSRVWPKGTVCIAIVGATIGESAILEFNACFPDSIIGMVPDPGKADSEFLDFLLQFVKTDLKEAGKGSARDNINLRTFSDRLFPIPDLKAQLAAIERISEIDKECRELNTEYATKLQDLDDLRQSLLQKAFAGELT